MNEYSSEMRQLAEKHADSMREQARNRAKKRKEEYLGARVSKELRERVLRHAEAINIPASLLIRQVLEQAFPASPSEGGKVSANNKTSDIDEVVAWEEVTLGKDMACPCCQGMMRKGDRVKLGLTSEGQRQSFLCISCQQSV